MNLKRNRFLYFAGTVALFLVLWYLFVFLTAKTR